MSSAKVLGFGSTLVVGGWVVSVGILYSGLDNRREIQTSVLKEIVETSKSEAAISPVTSRLPSKTNYTCNVFEVQRATDDIQARVLKEIKDQVKFLKEEGTSKNNFTENVKNACKGTNPNVMDMNTKNIYVYLYQEDGNWIYDSSLQINDWLPLTKSFLGQK